MKFILLVLGLLIGIFIGTTQLNQTDYEGLKRTDNQLIDKYQSVAGVASEQLGCAFDNNYPCVQQKTNEVRNLADEIDRLLEERKKYE